MTFQLWAIISYPINHQSNAHHLYLAYSGIGLSIMFRSRVRQSPFWIIGTPIFPPEFIMCTMGRFLRIKSLIFWRLKMSNRHGKKWNPLTKTYARDCKSTSYKIEIIFFCTNQNFTVLHDLKPNSKVWKAAAWNPMYETCQVVTTLNHDLMK